MINIYYLFKNNTPFYVGETSKPLKHRLNQHKRVLKDNDIDIALLDEVEDWRVWEAWWIEQFKAWGFILTNKNNGGGGCDKGTSKHTPESRKKIGSAREGKPLSEETKHKQSVSNTGISRNKGNTYARGHSKSPESRKSIGIKRSVSINQKDLNDNIIKTWPSIKEAADTLNIQHSDITNCCRGKGKTAGGFKWEYNKI
jgi:hypothetical protein